MCQGDCHAGGCFHWRCFPRVHAIASCIGDGSGMCHLLIAQRGHLWFLHVLGTRQMEKGPSGDFYDELQASRMSNCRSHRYTSDGESIYDEVSFITDRILFVTDV